MKLKESVGLVVKGFLNPTQVMLNGVPAGRLPFLKVSLNTSTSGFFNVAFTFDELAVTLLNW